MSQKRRHIRKTAALCSAAAMLLAACSSGAADGSDNGGSARLRTVTVALHFTPNGTFAPLYYAQKLGYYKDAGLDVRLEPGTTSKAALDQVAAGRAMLGTTSSPDLMLAIGAGTPVLSVGSWAGTGSSGFLVPNNSDIKSLKDLPGHSVVAPPGTPQQILLPAVLKAIGVDPSSVKVINIGSSAGANAFANGTGDVMAAVIPSAGPVVQKSRPSKAYYWSDLGVELPDYSFIASDVTMQKDSDVVRAFLTATYRGIAQTRKDPRAAVKAEISYFPQLSEDVTLQQIEGRLKLYCPPNSAGEPYGMHKATDWAKAVQLLQQYAGLNKTKPATDYYTNAFFNGAESVSVEKC